MKSIKTYIALFIALSKFKISFFVAISGLVGYLLVGNGIKINIVLIFLGILFLSSGSAALNSYQEIKTDRLMQRTKKRPLAANTLEPAVAISFIVFMFIFGLSLLYVFSNLLAVLMGIATIIMYNFIYTPLKPKTPLSIIPGSLSGAMPPLIAWISAGGNLLDKNIYLFGLFIFIWQIPHFSYVLLLHGEDYKQAGLKTIQNYFDKNQLNRFTFWGVVFLTLSVLLMQFYGMPQNILFNIIIIISGIFIIFRAKRLFQNFIEKKLIRNGFIELNLYVLLIVTLLSIDKNL